MVGTSLENTTSGGDEAMKNYQKKGNRKGGEERVTVEWEGMRERETFIGRMAYRQKRKRGE